MLLNFDWQTSRVQLHLQPEIQRIDTLVIAPHPDDEVIGMGGRIAGEVANNQSVLVVLLTDGAGSPRLVPTLDKEMAAIRHAEFELGLKTLGVSNWIELNYRSIELKSEKKGEHAYCALDAQLDLAAIFVKFAPRNVYVPCPFEGHPTHRIVTRLALDGLRASHLNPQLLGYEVWTALTFLAITEYIQSYDISPFKRLKELAIACHASQDAVRHYSQGMLGRNCGNATFWDAYNTGSLAYFELFMNMQPLIENPELSITQYCADILDHLTIKLFREY